MVIPNYNGMRWLPDCLNSIYSQEFHPLEILLIDNGSNDDSIDFIRKKFPDVHVTSLSKNFGFAKAVNIGIQKSKYDYVLLLNTDVVLLPGFLINLVTTLKHAEQDVGAVCPLMLQAENPLLIDNAGDDLSWYGVASKKHHGKPYHAGSLTRQEVLTPSAGATLYRRSFFEDCGLFDENFFAYLEDVDLGIRGRLFGYRYIFEPRAKIHHHGHGSKITWGRYIMLSTCNRVMIFLKNIPSPLLKKHFLKLIYGQGYFFLAYRRPFHSIGGYLRFFYYLPKVWNQRTKNMKKVNIQVDSIDDLLSRDKPSPTLGELVTGYFQAIKSKIWRHHL